MAVRRIVANLHAPDPAALSRFYREVFGLEPQFEMGWIAFLAGSEQGPAQLQLAAEGGSGTALPAVSITVDDLDAPLERLGPAGGELVYGPVREPWGVRRFYLRDPAGNLVNVVAHRAPEDD